jgi:hypothetical protein
VVAPRGRPFTVHPYYENLCPDPTRLPNFFQELLGTPVVSDRAARRFRGDLTPSLGAAELVGASIRQRQESATQASSRQASFRNTGAAEERVACRATAEARAAQREDELRVGLWFEARIPQA